MKASHRKTKTGFYPVIIFNNKSRLTHRVLCLTKDSAIKLANELIEENLAMSIKYTKLIKENHKNEQI